MRDLYSSFKAAVAVASCKVAVIYDGGLQAEQLTYSDVSFAASKIADLLHAASLGGAGTVVAVDCSPDVSLPSVIIGILQAGMTFMPVCKEQMLLEAVKRVPLLGAMAVQQAMATDDCRYKVALQLEGVVIRVMDLCAGWQLLILAPRIPLQHPIIDEKGLPVAYVVTTSGSTGSPKIVFVPHQCIMSNIVDLGRIFDMLPGTTMYLSSPLTFDAGIVQLFLPLCAGGTVLLTDETTRLTPSALVDALKRHRVTHLQVVPSYFKYIGADRVRSSLLTSGSALRVVAFGGECCPTPAYIRTLSNADCCCRFYNLYGLTEQSSWSTCTEIGQEWISSGLDIPVPLGSPLLDTQVEIRSESGDVVSDCGEGQLFLGGERRMCFIDDAVGPIKCHHWLATGDIVKVSADGSLIHFLGRMNSDVLKINGCKVNLPNLAQVARCLAGVTDACCFYADGTVYVCVESKASALSLELAELLTSQVRVAVAVNLPIDGQPTSVYITTRFELNENGKVDRRHLLSAAREALFSTFTEPRKSFYDMVALSMPGVVDAATVDGSCTFVQLGGNSLGAVQLSEVLATAYQLQDVSGRLLDMLLNLPLASVLSWLRSRRSHRGSSLGAIDEDLAVALKAVAEAFPGQRVHDALSSRDLSTAIDRGASDGYKTLAIDDRSALKDDGVPVLEYGIGRPYNLGVDLPEVSSQPDGGQHSGHNLAGKPHAITLHSGRKRRSLSLVSSPGDMPSQRRARSSSWSNLATKAVLLEGTPSVPLAAEGVTRSLENAGQHPCARPIKCDHSCEPNHLQLQIEWSIDTGKCVDASPAVCFVRDGDPVAFIGSHSAKFFAIDIKAGCILWTAQLGGRIEASAVVCRRSSVVAVGCYDGCLYCMSTTTGAIFWTFSSQNLIKSTPAVSDCGDILYFGSHDRLVYAVNVKLQQCLWSTALDGAVFASPLLHTTVVYAASLSGTVLAVDKDTGTTVWKTSLLKPVFASLRHSSSESLVYVCCVDQCVYGLQERSGTMSWCVRLGGAVFAAPRLFVDQHAVGEVMVVGCHGSPGQPATLCCLRAVDGDTLWCHEAEANITSVPSSVFNISHQQGYCCTARLTACCQINGIVELVDICTGEAMCTYSLPGEVFSSPHMLNCGRIIVGCRDDKVYCLKIVHLPP